MHFDLVNFFVPSNSITYWDIRVAMCMFMYVYGTFYIFVKNVQINDAPDDVALSALMLEDTCANTISNSGCTSLLTVSLELSDASSHLTPVKSQFRYLI